mgnify:FL=1
MNGQKRSVLLAVAALVACGDSDGLIPGDEASSLRDALDGVEAACANGQLARAEASALRFQRRVEQLRAAGVDDRLVANLRQGAQRLREVVADCDTVTETVPTTTETVPPPVDTTPQEPVTPTATTPPPTTTPDQGGTTPPAGGGRTTPPAGGGGGGGTTPPSGGGQQPSQPGGDTPVQPGDGSSQPNVNRGTPGGALAPGQGGTE